MVAKTLNVTTYITELQDKNDELTQDNKALLVLVARLESVCRQQNEALLIFARALNQINAQDLGEGNDTPRFTLH